MIRLSFSFFFFFWPHIDISPSSGLLHYYMAFYSMAFYSQAFLSPSLRPCWILPYLSYSMVSLWPSPFLLPLYGILPIFPIAYLSYGLLYGLLLSSSPFCMPFYSLICPSTVSYALLQSHMAYCLSSIALCIDIAFSLLYGSCMAYLLLLLLASYDIAHSSPWFHGNMIFSVLALFYLFSY